MGFPERLKALRLEANLTQKDMAEKFDISQQAYAKWEMESANPTKNVITKLASFFNVTVDYLVGNTNYRSSEEVELSEIEMLYRTISLNMTDEEKVVFKQELLDFMKKKSEIV
ncbi:helix-turn-helix transcriptional regulator [Streptococcus suis]|uniref:Transcriptional regulator with XRE-family HTH domain n=1 Tax=Streptococcus parasuis TaxID=1501662 RepID=A0ABV2ESH1_9STRE|nr:helix-turn-helix transcriptional regulator [Streptococcus parasuis]MCQ8267000.1 helix-turn-helix domain-containing protein [Streptococcus suis]NQK67410.1 helix-turn-helix transcriptional regulator [Streptococcus suis]WNF87423.1 helix-turn-helix transcriptional regulator [Streptococcus parasuis]BCP60495.1 transcriptional regulator [Streptococcus parasuis]BCP62571.1 transcriptional regulator [Streptococcus parasuis]